MSQNRKKEIEAKGTNVDQAIVNGLQRLGVKKEQVEITVLDEGSRGLLGIGARDAVVRLVIQAPAPESKPKPKPAPKAAPAAPKPEKKKEKPVQQKKVEPAPQPEPKRADRKEEAAAAIAPAPDSDEKTLAVEVVGRLLAEMKIDATIETRLSEPDDLNGRQLLILDIQGDDLGMLVGTRGETLNSLQYIARLMVGHRLQERASFIVDVEGYRQRREQALARLAERMAEKVVKRSKPVSLEPMPAHERRIIHMTLRNNDDVYTESSGEGRRRKVRIYPK